MGLLKQIIRGIKQSLRDLRKRFSRPGSRKKRKYEPTVLHPSWKKGSSLEKASAKKAPEFIMGKGKKRIPGFLMFKRILAGFLFLVNFVLSQFLLASFGEQSFGTFLIFLGNAFIIADYLWKTRRKSE